MRSPLEVEPGYPPVTGQPPPAIEGSPVVSHPMQQRPLGRAGLLVSRLALGTMTWGRDTAPDDAAAQLKTFVEAGGNLLDTADVYADGDAESVLGTLLSGVVDRGDVLIATKAGL